MKPRVIAIIQGRMSSSRLPGKILADIAGQPMLQRVFARTSRAATVTETVFATTTDSSDDPVAEYCDFSGIPFTRGSQFDVLDRYYQSARQMKADVVVRITADCPIIDPDLIDDAVNAIWGRFEGMPNPLEDLGRPLLPDELVFAADFVCNRLPPPWHRTYPIGLDVEVCTVEALKKAWKEAREPQHREHAMPYFYEGVELNKINRGLEYGVSPRGYRIALLHHTADFGDYRWTVDTPEDLEFMREAYACFNGRDDFTWKEVLGLVHDNPELMKINSGVQHKTLKDVDKRALK
ncbi:MAG: glycosyltransferase family protein [Anaerolineales bacterium]|nr:MAG: glycosyltransferase family protein [Anaerolineales bacterium]